MTRDPALGAADPPEPALEPPSTLEFVLAPEDALPLVRLPGLVRTEASRPARLLWYDDSASSLTDAGVALLRDGPGWRLERLAPGPAAEWPACSPAPLLSEADLSTPPPLDAAPVAAFDGRRRAYRAGAVDVTLLHGTLRGVVAARPACRLTLSGPAAALGETLQAMAELHATVPRATLGREALAIARGAELPARHIGGPALDAEIAVTDGLAAIVGHLLDALLHWTDQFRSEQQPHAVHQARVATRRLRSALSLYKRVAACPEFLASGHALKTCATVLGAARDWDVFLGGAGALLAATAGADPRIATLLRAAERRRGEAYAALAAYLAGPEFRRLELDLGVAAVLRPWEHSSERDRDGVALHEPTAPFAAEVLTRRLRHVRRRGRGLRDLPIAALHELRKDCKRLRYAAEFFASASPARHTKPFLRRLSALQEDLGTLNDTASVANLMAQLGRAGRGYASGKVEGFAAAAAAPARARVVKRWKRFKDVPPFWT